MRRRDILAALLAAATLAGPALAQGYVDSVVAQLRKLGFRSIVQERTLLGRVRITAKRKDGTREIIINPRTGEILRDLWIPVKGGKKQVVIIDDKSGKRRDDDDDDDDEDGDDDEDEDDDDDDDKGKDKD